MSDVIRKKSGIPSADDYSDALLLHAYSKLCTKLRKLYPSTPIDEKYLAHHVLDLTTFIDVSINA